MSKKTHDFFFGATLQQTKPKTNDTQNVKPRYKNWGERGDRENNGKRDKDKTVKRIASPSTKDAAQHTTTKVLDRQNRLGIEGGRDGSS